MRIAVNDDRLFIILEPMVTHKTIVGKDGRESRIELPENHHERSRIGVVQQVGNKVTRYVPGDKVLISTYGGVRIHLIGRQIDGQDIDEDCYRIIREEEVVCQLFD